MIVDPWVWQQQQQWVIASQKTSENAYNNVYLKAPTTTSRGLFLEIGDAPPEWQGQNPPLPDTSNNAMKNAMKDMDRKHYGYSERERLELPREELLQLGIDKVASDIAEAEWEQNHPQEAAAKKLAQEAERQAAFNIPKQREWYEYMNAIDGAWLKATTGPPEGTEQLHVLLVRKGAVVDVIKSTIKRFCEWKTPEYRSGAQGGDAAWGVSLSSGRMILTLFQDEMKIGDCIVLQVEAKDELVNQSDSVAVVGNGVNNPDINDHVQESLAETYLGRIDLDLVAKQTKIMALKLTKPNHYNNVYFERPLQLTDTNTVPVPQVGDQLWPDNPTKDSALWDEREATFRQQERAYLTQTPEEQLQDRIANLQKALQELIDLRDVPGKREEMFEKERAKEPVQWDQAAVALNGAWIKASTMPSNGLEPVHSLLIRQGKVIEVFPSTLAKLSRFSGYNASTGKYNSSGGGISRSSPWGISVDIFTLRNALETTLEVGDCVVLHVNPLLCEGGQWVH